MKQSHSTGLFYKSEGDAPNVIGNTQSGKQVLGGNAESYSGDFDSEDHRDAEKIHSSKKAKLQTRAKMSMLQSGKFNHKLLSSLANQASHHSEQQDYHKEQAEAEPEAKPITETEGVEKSCGTTPKRVTPDSLSGESTEEPLELWSTIDIALEKGRGPDKQKRKHKGEGAKPGGDLNLYGETVGIKPFPKTPKTPKEGPPPPTRTLGIDEIPFAHYSKPNNQAYRSIMNKLGEKAHGVLTYHHHTDQVHVLDQEKWKGIKNDLTGKKTDG